MKLRGVRLEPSRLVQILKSLSAKPNLRMPDVVSLHFHLGPKDNYGARYFAAQTLPRIRWANRNIDIQFTKLMNPDTKKPIRGAASRMEVQLRKGEPIKWNLRGKDHRTILDNLMTVAGGPEWAEFIATGEDPIVGQLSEKKSALREKIQADEESAREDARVIARQIEIDRKEEEKKEREKEKKHLNTMPANPFQLPGSSLPRQYSSTRTQHAM